MPIPVECRNGHQYKVKKIYAGKRIKCPVCETPTTVPKADSGTNTQATSRSSQQQTKSPKPRKHPSGDRQASGKKGAKNRTTSDPAPDSDSAFESYSDAAPALPPRRKKKRTKATEKSSTDNAHRPSHQTNRSDGGLLASNGQYGGIDRKEYLLVTVGMALFWTIVEAAVSVAAWVGGTGVVNAYSLIVWPFAIIGFLIGIGMAYQRLENLGVSGMFCLLMFVPIANVVLFAALMCCPEGFADHRRLDKPGWMIFAVLVGIATLGGVWRFVSNIAAVGS